MWFSVTTSCGQLGVTAFNFKREALCSKRAWIASRGRVLYMPIRTLREDCLQVMRGKLNQWALDTSVSIVTKAQARRLGRRRSVLAGTRNLSLLQSIKKRLWGPRTFPFIVNHLLFFSEWKTFSEWGWSHTTTWYRGYECVQPYVLWQSCLRDLLPHQYRGSLTFLPLTYIKPLFGTWKQDIEKET